MNGDQFLTDPQAERELVAAILSITNRGRLDEWLPLLEGPEFDDPHLGEIWTVARQLNSAGKRVNQRSIITERDTEPIHARLKKLAGDTTDPHTVVEKTKTVRDLHLKRKLYEHCYEIRKFAKTDMPYSELLEFANDKLREAEADESDGTVVAIGSVLDEWRESVSRPRENVRIFPTPWSELNDMLFGGMNPGRLYTVGARPGVGKAASLDTPIPTPQGWTTMGEIKAGDRVYDENGRICNVVATSEVWQDRPVYRLKFSDGTWVDADENHEWLTETRASRKAECGSRNRKRNSPYGRDQRHLSEKPSVKTTKAISETIRVDCDNRINHSIPLPGPVEGPETKFIIPPYTFGVWLGDGTTKDGAVTLNTEDSAEILNGVHAEGEEPYAVPSGDNGTSQLYRFPGLRVRLREIGALGDKHIPVEYLRASVGQRLALLRGIMDTDGHTGKAGGCELTFMCKQLAYDSLELIRSLGIVAHIAESDAVLKRRVVGRRWRITFTTSTECFTVARKLSHQKPKTRATTHRRYIQSAEYVGRMPTKCIEVDSPSHMFLVGDFHPTHNSIVGANIAQHAAEHGRPALLFSLEMSTTEVLSRVVSSGAEAELGRIMGHNLDDWSTRKIDEYVPKARDLPFFICDKPGVTVEWIASQARSVRRQHGLDVIIVDYLQLLKPVDSRVPRQEQVAAMSWALKSLARELDVAIVLMAQLNRQSVSEGRPPEASDLRESGAIEQDSDGIWLLNPVLDANKNPTGEVDVLVRKSRQGRVGSVRLASRAHYGKFSSIAAYDYSNV